MGNEILISGALANTYGKANTQDLVDFLVSETDDLAVYQLRQRPGTITAAAFDWQAIIGTTASLLYIGELIWRAYERFIKPLRENDIDSRSFLYIVVKNPDGKSVQFSLGTDKLEREDFIEFFNRAVSDMRLSSHSDENSPKYPEIENSDIWIRRNKK